MSRRDPVQRGRRAAVGRVLRLALRGDGLTPEDLQEAAGHDGGDALVEAAVQHRVVPQVRRALAQAGLAPEVDARLRDQQLTAQLHVLRLRAELPRVLAALRDLDFVLVKGPLLGDGTASGSRSYVDLDVLVSPGDTGAAVEALEGVGYVLRERNWSLLERLQPGELLMVSDRGLAVDLHWHLLQDPEDRQRFRVPTRELLARRGSVVVDGHLVPRLDAVDGLLHLVLHAVKSGGDRLVWFADVTAWLEREAPDPDELVRRAHAWRTALATAHVLRLSRVLCGAHVPDDVLRRLDPLHATAVVARLVQRLAPVEQAGGPSVGRLLTRSLGERVPSSVLVLGLRALASTRPGQHETETAFDPDPRGDEPAGRRRFLAGLARQDT